MSNYRVRQVLALGRIPERQLRLLVALATWMNDDTRTVRLGFDALIRDTGNVRNTVRAARADAAAGGRLAWEQPQRGRGHLTVWTVLCLPDKGVNEPDPLTDAGKGVNRPAEKGSTEPEKRGQPQPADLPEPDHGLNRRAETSGSLSARARELLTAVDPQVSERESDFIIEKIKLDKGRNILAIVRTNIADGDAAAVIGDARAALAEAEAKVSARDAPEDARQDRPPVQWATPEQIARSEQIRRAALADMHSALSTGKRPACDRNGGGRYTDACRHGDGRSCIYSWCECSCHKASTGGKRP